MALLTAQTGVQSDSLIVNQTAIEYPLFRDADDLG